MMCSYLPCYNNLCFGLGRLAYRFPRGKIADVFCRWKAEAWGKSRLLIHLNRVPCGGHGAIPIRPCLKMGVCHGISSGWWFQTWLEQISIIYGIILPVDFHSYFFRGVETTNQSYMSQSHPPNLKKKHHRCMVPNMSFWTLHPAWFLRVVWVFNMNGGRDYHLSMASKWGCSPYMYVSFFLVTI